MRGLTGQQVTLFRGALGAYLLLHVLALVPWAEELFSSRGMLADPTLNPLHGVLPNLLVATDQPVGVLVALAGLSVLLALGRGGPWVPLLTWYGWACLFNANPLISNPSLPYVGWMILACALVPRDQPLPPILLRGAWLLLGMGYTASGLHKLTAPSWVDGSALRHVLELPLARPTALRELALSLPDLVLELLTWGALGAELLFLPALLWARTRLLAWLALVAMHVGIVVFVDFADLSVGMLLVHALTFDPGWVRGTSAVSPGRALRRQSAGRRAGCVPPGR